MIKYQQILSQSEKGIKLMALDFATIQTCCRETIDEITLNYHQVCQNDSKPKTWSILVGIFELKFNK